MDQLEKRTAMKIFVPVTDEILRNADAMMQTSMVPFDPDFLRERSDRRREGFKPDDWISSNDYASARKRLRASMTAEVAS